jgi:hypothetical protein
VLCSLFGSTAYAETRQVSSLDGVWNFATDPDNRGEKEKWYHPNAKLPAMPLPGYAPSADGRIQVPGIWDNQGYGAETDKVRHNFVGKGWYKRQTEIPLSWAGRRAFLVITGVNRYSKVWIDDHYLGEHIGYLSTQEYDVTPYALPGKTVTITIQVDSKQRWDVDAMYGTSSLADFMDVAWGGIWGHVFLEARSDTWLNDLFVQSDIQNATCSVSATIHGKTGIPDAAKLEVFDKNKQRVAETAVKLSSGMMAGSSLSITSALPNAALWTPDSPTLYTARLSILKGGNVLDVVESRFGMRQFSIDGYRILLNGKRIMLRGYGDDHIYPRQMAMPYDKESHLQQLRMIQSYGFNHVRHHSTIMPPEYYDACDELGIITTAEFPIAYYMFLPGSGETWKSRVPAGTAPAQAIETYKREWTATIKQHRNHPSILCWVMGNELHDAIPNITALRNPFVTIARQHDPYRFFLDADGGVTPNLQTPCGDRDTLAFCCVCFDEASNPFANPDKLRMPRPKKPIIEHEAGNYVTFSRPDLPDQFQHNFKPFWLESGRARLEKLGLLHEASLWAEKSERLYALLHKCNLESLRKNPHLSGYHWWLFQDYWTSSNGLVDHYFRPKSITKEEVLQFNNEVVVLQDGLQRTHRAKNRLQLKLLASNFSADGIKGRLDYEVKVGTRSLVQKQHPITTAPQGELSNLAAIDLELPEVRDPTQLRITAMLYSGEKRFRNDWATWLYPSQIKPQISSSPVFADDSQQKRFAAWNVKPMSSGGNLSPKAVYLAGKLNARLLDAMNDGACVVMLDGVSQFLKSYPVTFQTSWWQAGGSREQNNTGTFVYDHPVTRGITPDGWCDDGWCYLIDGGCKFDLQTMPARPGIMIRALPSLMLPVDEALLFEVGVGKGCLIVSGLNHRRAEGLPENEWILAKLIEYAATLPQPKTKWPVTSLTERLSQNR